MIGLHMPFHYKCGPKNLYPETMKHNTWSVATVSKCSYGVVHKHTVLLYIEEHENMIKDTDHSFSPLSHNAEDINVCNMHDQI